MIFNAIWDTFLLTTHLSSPCASFNLTLWLLEGVPPQGHKSMPSSDRWCSCSLYTSSSRSSTSCVALKPLQQNLPWSPNWSIDLYLPSVPSLPGIIGICSQPASLLTTHKDQGRSLQSGYHYSLQWILWYMMVTLSMEGRDVLWVDFKVSVHTLSIFGIHMEHTWQNIKHYRWLMPDVPPTPSNLAIRYLSLKQWCPSKLVLLQIDLVRH